MARPSLELVQAIRKAAKNIAQGQPYQWGHMGSCNCGHLAQELTKLTNVEIHERAMSRHGDWNEQLNDYCPTSGLPMDELISSMLAVGLDTSDLKKLETLSHKEVLQRFPIEERWLKHNLRDDVVKYMLAWADLLEEQLLEQVDLPKLEKEGNKQQLVSASK